MLRRVRFAVVACATIAFQALAANVCLQPGSELEFPQVVGPSFVRGAVHDYETTDPGGGCSVRYVHPSGMWADIYVYSNGMGTIEDRERDPEVLKVFQELMSAIHQSWSSKGSTVRDLEARYETRGAAHRVEVMMGKATLDTPDRGTLFTRAALWTGKGLLWKLRVTFAEKDAHASDPAVLMLSDALVDLSRSSP